MNIINENMYIVVVSGGAGDDAPKYNGARVAGVYTTLDEAKAKLQAIADEWKDSIDEENWKPGYCDDPEGCKYADNFYAENGLTAWHNGNEGNWERVEIFNCDKYGCWNHMFM